MAFENWHNYYNPLIAAHPTPWYVAAGDPAALSVSTIVVKDANNETVLTAVDVTAEQGTTVRNIIGLVNNLVIHPISTE